jgi:hypothetical protein
METKNWINYTPSGQNGNGAVAVQSAKPHTGRSERSMSGKVQGQGANAAFTVRQKAAQAFLQAGIISGNQLAGELKMEKKAAAAYIYGLSNHKRIRVSLNGAGNWVSLTGIDFAAGTTVADFAAAGWTDITNNPSVWTEIPGDPGRASRFLFRIALSCERNFEPGERNTGIRVEADNEATDNFDKQLIVNLISRAKML